MSSYQISDSVGTRFCVPFRVAEQSGYVLIHNKVMRLFANRNLIKSMLAGPHAFPGPQRHWALRHFGPYGIW